MKKKFFYFLTVLLLSACSTSQITYAPDQLTIQSANTTSVYQSTLITQRKQNFSTLFIDQKILKLPEGNLIVYEHAYTDLQYEFEPALKHIINIVFESRGIVAYYIGTQLSAYQIVLPNGQWLNLIAQQSDTQELTFLYGMNTKQFESMIKKADPNATFALHKKGITFHKPYQAVQSRWTTKKVHFVPLVVPFHVSPLH